MIRSFAGLTAAAIALGAAPASAQTAPSPMFSPAQMDCPALISQTEQRRNIPRGLLMAIAVTESSLNGRPNPYAMNIAGRAYHARDFQDMSNVITANYARGVRSIDVGCMQVNLLYHGSKFPSYASLLDPTTNVNYGATYLINLAIESGSWKDAVMSYHNKRNPSRRAYYGCAVWNNYLKISRAKSGYLSCRGGAPSTASVNTVAARAAPRNQAGRPSPLAAPVDRTPVDVAARRPSGSISIVADGQPVAGPTSRQVSFTSVQPDDWSARQAAKAVAGFGRVTRDR